MKKYVNDIYYFYDNIKFSDWELIANSVDQFVISECIIFAFSNSQDLKLDASVLFDENYSLGSFSKKDFESLKEIKNLDINNNRWLTCFRINLKELIEFANLEDIDFIFDDRFVIDQLGNHLDIDDLLSYGNLSVTIQKKLNIYVFPKINHFVDSILQIIRNRWSAYEFKMNKINSNYVGINNHAVIFVFDSIAEVQLINGEPVQYQFSHTKHLVQHLNAFIQRGYTVLIDQKGVNHLLVVDEIIPVLKIQQRVKIDLVEDKYRIVAYCSIYLTDFLNTNFCKRHDVINILIQPAVHWVENAKFFHPDFLTIVQAVAPYIDIVVTQNDRMIELTKALLQLAGNRIADENYLSVPLSIWSLTANKIDFREKIRNLYGYCDGHKVIVNGGGAWDWTDTAKFIEKFINYCRIYPDTNLRFIQMGLRQPLNNDHQDTIDLINRILDNNKDIAHKFIKIEDWDIASKLLPSALWAFDYGFSVSKPTVEGFQAHRVRLTEYVQHSLIPIINSFDSLYCQLEKSAYAVSSEYSYEMIFQTIEFESAEYYHERQNNLSSFVAYVNSIGDSNKIVDCLDKHKFAAINRSFATFSSIETERRIIDVIKRGYYNKSYIYNELQSDEININRRHLLLRVINKAAYKILPQKLHRLLYTKAAKFL
jgi:hypothetical protein